MQSITSILRDHRIYETVRLTRNGENGTAFIFDRLAKENELNDAETQAIKENGCFVSSRSYRYAPEIREQFVFIPDTVAAAQDLDLGELMGY